MKFLKRHRPEEVKEVLSESEEEANTLRKADWVSSTKVYISVRVTLKG